MRKVEIIATDEVQIIRNTEQHVYSILFVEDGKTIGGSGGEWDIVQKMAQSWLRGLLTHRIVRG